MTAKEVMEEFGIPQMGKHTEFELMPAFRKKDPRNGEIRTGRQQNFSPVYDLQLPEVGTIQIRFAESRVAKSGGGYDYKVTNDRITDLRGEKMAFLNGKNIEKYVWFFLHPRCNSNPFRERTKQSIFQHIDREAIANLRLAVSDLSREISIEISEMDHEALRVMAAGLTYRFNNMEQPIANLETMGVGQLRVQLLDRLAAHGKAFTDAWRNGNNTVHGMLSYAVDAGLIKLQKVPGAKFWMWNTATHKDIPICQMGPLENEMAALKLAFAQNSGELYPILAAAVDTKRVKNITLPGTLELGDIDGLTLAAVQAKGIKWIVQQAIVNDLIALDRGTKTIKFLHKGEFSTDVMSVTDPATWKEELIAALALAEYKPQREGVTNRLFNFLKPDAAGFVVPVEAPVAAVPEPVEEQIEETEPEPEFAGEAQ